MLDLPRLCAIVDEEIAANVGRSVPDLAAAYIEGGARFLQLRAKTASSRQMLQWAEQLAALSRAAGARLVINDRLDLALIAGVSAIHVGQDDLPPVILRRWMGEEAFIGLSTHTPDQIEQAFREPIAYLAVGPVFATRTKDTGYDAVGLDFVRLAARLAGAEAARTGAAPLPVVAIGGITLDNARSVIDAGAASVAIISDLVATGDPVARTRAIIQRLDA